MIGITLTVHVEKRRHLKLVHSNHEVLKRDVPARKDKPLLTLVNSKRK